MQNNMQWTRTCEEHEQLQKIDVVQAEYNSHVYTDCGPNATFYVKRPWGTEAEEATGN